MLLILNLLEYQEIKNHMDKFYKLKPEEKIQFSKLRISNYYIQINWYPHNDDESTRNIQSKIFTDGYVTFKSHRVTRGLRKPQSISSRFTYAVGD